MLYFFELEKGEWILLTSLLVLQQSFISTRQRLLERVLGTLYGVVAGILLVQLLPTLAGHIILLLISYYLFFYYTKHKYAIAVVFVTIIRQVQGLHTLPSRTPFRMLVHPSVRQT